MTSLQRDYVTKNFILLISYREIDHHLLVHIQIPSFIKPLKFVRFWIKFDCET